MYPQNANRRIHHRRAKPLALSDGPNSQSNLIVVMIVGILLVCSVSPSSTLPWVGPGVLLSVLVVTEFVTAFKYRVPLFELMVIYYLVALFWSSLILHFYYPHVAPAMSIRSDDYSNYLSYTIPCIIMLYLGGTLAIRGRKSPHVFGSRRVVHVEPPSWVAYTKPLIWIGIGFFFIQEVVSLPSEIGFVIVLLGSLRWVGLFILILSKESNDWLGFAALIISQELVQAVHHTIFIHFVLWCACFLCILVYRRKWKARIIVGSIFWFLCLLLLQNVKSVFRSSYNLSLGVSQISAFRSLLFDQVANPSLFLDNAGYSLVRFNQGWIVNRTLNNVPARVPYANGSTLVDDFVAVAMPRFLLADKIEAGGFQLFNRYTGQTLVGGTSMVISPVAELYVNFGRTGGIIGMFVFGILVGSIYRCLADEARYRPEWWAWGPFVGLWLLKADEDLSNSFNWAFKAFLLMGAIIWLCNRGSHKTGRDVRSRLTREAQSAQTPPASRI